MTRRRVIAVALLLFTAIIAGGFFIPEKAVIPVDGASRKDWNPKSFWYEPWGISGVHKGIDIFAPQGRKVVSAVPGIVVYRGQMGLGGNVVAVLGPKWRLHYYAHLASYEESVRFVEAGTEIGKVGTSGNAAGKPPHLHYTVFSLVPLPWRITGETQGWRKMFYLDPAAAFANDAARVPISR